MSRSGNVEPGAREAASGGPTIDKSLREATVMDRAGYSYVVHPLMDGVPRVAPRLLQEWTDWAASRTDVLRNATVILAPEAMALPLAACLSLRTGLPYAIARKRNYGLPGEVIAESLTGYGKSALHVNDLGPGDHVVIIDDVMSTGHTLTALIAAVRQAGATPVGALLFIDKGTPDASAAARVSAEARLPVLAMRRILVRDGRVEIVPP